MKPPVEAYVSAQGTRIYRIPLRLFPGMHGYAHLIIDGQELSLFDVGSGFGNCNEDLEAGLEDIRVAYDETVSWERISKIFISHGHIDHYGGLNFVRERTDAPIIIHELERRVLTNYDSRLSLVAGRLERFLIGAGIQEEERQEVMEMYLLHKQLFSSIQVQATYEELGMRSGKLLFEHVPGHCPGHVIAWVDDILLSGDHILRETSPHQAPESLSLNMGLEHYLNSLAKVAPRAHRASWTLGGHEGPIEDLPARIHAIVDLHRGRLLKILRLFDEPKTIGEVSHQLFPKTEGYHRLLALEETGAHVEYLHTRGYISIEDSGTPEQGSIKVNRYVHLAGGEPEFPGLKIFSESIPLNGTEAFNVSGMPRALRAG
ncbi:MAG: MBL fold metallo-hydrolase [Anaerolineales bacterium]|nr:MBL fold metallo-hydrolase [Anaerolineales bacterium]